MEAPPPLEKQPRSVVTKKLAPRRAKGEASAKLAGFDSVGHQDLATRKKLNTAALLILAHERQGGKMKPAAALTHADLPSDGPMRKRLARRVGGLRKAMEAVEGGLGLAQPQDSDDEELDEMPALLSDAAHAAALAKKEERIEQLVKDRKAQGRRAREAAKKAEKKIAELDEKLKKVNKQAREHTIVNQELNVELDVTKEELEKYMAENPDEEVDELVREVNFFENGRYGNTIRMIYYTLLHCSVAPASCRHIVGTTLKLLGIKADRLPGEKTARLMNLERSAACDMHAAELLLKHGEGEAAFAGDEATKMGKSRFALGFFANEDGPGSPIIFAALGVIDSLGGTAAATTEAITTLLTRIANNHSILKRLKGDTDDTKLENLLRTFQASMSDSCAAQVNCNALMMDLIVGARLGEDCTEDQKQELRQQLRSFYCWLHKAINICKATLKGLQFTEQTEMMKEVDEAVNAEDPLAELQDLSLHGEGELAKPQAPGQGHMAVWAIFKLLCDLFQMDTLRRGEAFNSMISLSLSLSLSVSYVTFSLSLSLSHMLPGVGTPTL